MSQAIPAITIQANVPYEFTVPESPAPASAIIVTNTGLVPVQWSTGQSSGYIPNGTTLAISVTAAGTIVTFSADTGLTLYITVWTINDGPVFVPQGSPITEVNLAAGATVELASGTTVDINNVARGTINIDEIASGNSLGANAVADNPIPPPSAPSVTVVGTAGSTFYYYEQSFLVDPVNGVETTASPVTQITNGNAALSNTNYNTVAVQNLYVPSYLGGNLVYDSNLTNAIAPTGATWNVNGNTIGTANGDFNVLDGGSDSAKWVYYGTGSATGRQTVNSLTFGALPSTTYTISALMDMTNVTAGTGAILVYDNNGTFLGALNQSAGENGQQSAQITTISTSTGIFLEVGTVGFTVTSGSTVSWSQIQFTKTSTVQPYQPGPLWTVKTFRNGYHIPALDTTLLSCNDEGQVFSGDQPRLVNLTGQTVKVFDQALFNLDAPVSNSSSAVWSSGPDTVLQPLVAISLRKVSVTCVSTVTNSAGYLSLYRGDSFSFINAYFSGSIYGLVWDSEVPILMNPGDYITFTPEPISGQYATFQITLLWGNVV